MANDPRTSLVADLTGKSGSDFIDLRQLGTSGLRQHSGFVAESVLKELEGRRAVEIYKEMSQTDTTCASLIYAIEKTLRGVEWHVTPASSAPFDVEAAEFVESCMHDMEESWTDFVSTNLTGMLVYGHALVETCYKRRGGDVPQGHMRSKFSDGRIGWRGHMGRSQDSIYRWLFDDHGKLLGAEQQAPPHFRVTKLPLDKCLLFRTSAEKSNPEGTSILRSAYRAYYIKRGIENIEAVGVEKDISGLPVVWIPRELLALSQQPGAYEDGTPNLEVAGAKAMVARFEQMATEVRRDAKEGLVMPLEYDEGNNKRFDITLLASGGPKQLDCDKIISRWDSRILMGVMADFLMLGQGASAAGSWAMHSDKRSLWLESIQAFLGIFAEALNNHAVPRLLRYNTLQTSEMPKIEFGSLQQPDLAQQGDLLVKCAQSGMQLMPDDNLEAHFRRMAGWPEKVDDLGDLSDISPQPQDDDDTRRVVTDVTDGLTDPYDPTVIGQGVPLTGKVVTNVAPHPKPVTNTQGPAPYV